MVETSFMIVISGVSCDTNILVYSIDLRDPQKHGIAKRVVDECSDMGCAVSLQCLSEFFRAVTMKHLLPIPDARRIVQILRRSMNVFPMNEADLLNAMAIYQRYDIQFFDALLIATVERAGCTTLISEDMQHEGHYGGVTVVNPFKLSPSKLDHLLA